MDEGKKCYCFLEGKVEEEVEEKKMGIEFSCFSLLPCVSFYSDPDVIFLSMEKVITVH